MSPAISVAAQVHALLGEGGFGVVHAVTKRRAPGKGKWFALKMLSKTFVLQNSCLTEVPCSMPT